MSRSTKMVTVRLSVFGLWSWVMWCLADELRMLWNWDQSVLQEEGNTKRAKYSSASPLNESQSAFLRLVKV